MKKVLIALFVILALPSTIFAQETTPDEKTQWGANFEVTYISLLKKAKVGWYATAEYGARFAPSNSFHLLLLEGGIVIPIQRFSSTILLIGTGADYSFSKATLIPVVNTSFENPSIGFGAKGIFENGIALELTAIKYVTVGDSRFAFGGGYIFKKNIPILKILIPFQR